MSAPNQGRQSPEPERQADSQVHTASDPNQYDVPLLQSGLEHELTGLFSEQAGRTTRRQGRRAEQGPTEQPQQQPGRSIGQGGGEEDGEIS